MLSATRGVTLGVLGDARHFSVVFQAGSGKSCQKSKACVCCACSTLAD